VTETMYTVDMEVYWFNKGPSKFALCSMLSVQQFFGSHLTFVIWMLVN